MNNLPSTVVNWDDELKGATMLVKSGLTPKDINRPEAALFVILAGRDMGLSPVQSLRSIRIIQGKLELSADIQLGKFHERGGRSQWLKLTDEAVELKLMAPWSIEPHVSTFTITDAKRAGLMSSQTWQKYPKAMLRSRAITQGLKDIGFILGSGVYAPGEISGGEVIIDQNTGEVLPGEVTVAEKVVDADVKPMAGAVEALPEATQEQVLLTAQLIASSIKTANTSGALNVYMAIDNADEKVAVKSHLKTMLDKNELKLFRHAYDELCRQQISAGVPKEEQSAKCDIRDVRMHIVNGDLDLAADAARDIDDATLYAAAMQEVQAARANAERRT